MKNVFAIVVCVLMVSACGIAGEAPKEAAKSLSGRITVSGAWALYPMVVKWAEEFRKVHPDMTIDVSAGGAGKGMADALSGAVDLGMVSRSVNAAEIEKGAWWVSVVKDAVVPTMNSANPLCAKLLKRGLKREEFAAIWITGSDSENTWKAVAGLDEVQIHVYTRSDSCGAAETWAKYLGKSQEDLRGVGVYGDPGLAEAVRKDQFGVGFNNINFLFDGKTRRPVQGICPLPVDVNANGQIDKEEDCYATLDEITKAIGEGRYPSPPARDLHLVGKGLPKNPAVVEFLRWCLSDGQKFVEEAGYICLPSDKLNENMGKLQLPK